MKRLYLDHNATSPLAPEVRTAMRESLSVAHGNAGSIHQEGQRARSIVERARRTILGALPGTVGSLTFTSGATEANNMILLTYAKRGPIALSRLDHPSVVEVGQHLAESGAEVRWLPHRRDGTFDEEALVAAARGASLISVAHGNNELGILRDVDVLARVAARSGALLHLDASQTFGRFAMPDLSGVAAVTLSAHKAGGPVAVGGLFLRGDASVLPLSRGGHQERGRRPGTEDVIGLTGWQALVDAFDAQRWTRLASLRDALESALVSRFGGVVNGGDCERLPNTSNLSFVGTEAEELVMALDMEGVAISAGSACTAGSMDVSSVLMALPLSDERARSAIRLSLGPEWSREMVELALERFSKVFQRIRS